MHYLRCFTIPLAALLAILCAFPLMAQGGQPTIRASWWDRTPEVKSGHYLIKSDLPRAELRDLAAHLDMTFEAYVQRLGSLKQRLPAEFNVLIFKDRQDYLTTLSFRYGVNATGSGGMFFVSQQGTALAFYTGGLPIRRVHHVLQHEGFHQIAHALFANNLEPWVNEGLAEFFGEAVMVGRKLVLGQSNPRVIQNIKDAIETGEYIGFRRMLTMGSNSWNANVQSGDARLQYEQAWSMVHFLVYGDDGRYATAFSNYLRLLNAGFDSYSAFVRAFETDDIQSFERRWKEHALQQKPSVFITAMERIEFLGAGMMELARRGQRPETIEELKTSLRDINFTYVLSSHGIHTEFSAADDALFLLPSDGLADGAKPPVFMVDPSPPRITNIRERRLEQTNPTPPRIETVGLKPNNVIIKWVRDPESNTFTFRVLAR